MSKLDAFILAQEKRHGFLVSEIQKSEQRVIDEIKDTYEERISALEHCRSKVTGIITGLTIAWASLAGAVGLVYQHQDKVKGMKP